jgi:O-antigen ligase
MFLSLKELFVVLVIAAAIFRLAKPAAGLFITPADITRRRNVWFLLTIAGFLSPSFWLYVLVAIPAMVIAGRKDSNPAALYLLLLQVVPPVDIPVPMLGMGRLIDINNYLLLSFFVLVPASVRFARSKDPSQKQGFTATDFCLLAYGILCSVLYLHTQTPDGGLYPGSMTESLRRAVIFFFDIFIPYFLISRTCANQKAIVDSMASACLGCALMSAIALFESGWHWLLYGEMFNRWTGIIGPNSYIDRGGILRAMASSGHSMALGYMLVIAFGFWLYLRTRVKSRGFRLGATGLYMGGLLAAYTRGAWVGAGLVYFLYAGLRPGAFTKFAKAIGVAATVALLVLLSPLGDRIIRVLPALGGSVDIYNITYRHRLFERAWELIQQSPILGDQAALLQMQDLRQGQGIIDLVNTYLDILLSNGFLGLTLFMLFVLIPIGKSWSLSRRIKSTDPDLSMLGACLVACSISMLVILENGSLLGGPQKIFYAVISLSAAYAYLGRSQRLTVTARRP